MDAVKVAVGALLIAFSFVVMVQTGTVTPVPLTMAALGALGLSAATLLLAAVTA